MTATTVSVTCDISQVDAAEFAGARLDFKPSSADYDTAGGDTFPAHTVSVELDASGVGVADLWPVDLGTRNIHYSVTLVASIRSAVNGAIVSAEYPLGTIRPQSGTTPNLADLLAQSSGGVTVGSTIYATLADAVAAAVAAAAAAENSSNQATVAALAAGAPIVTSLPSPVPADDTVVVLQTGPGAAVYQVEGGAWVFKGWLALPEFDTVAEMLASEDTFPVGAFLTAAGFRYKVVASGEHLTTAGGVKLLVLPFGGAIYLEAFGIDDDSNITAIFEKALLARPAVIATQRKYTGLTISAQITADLSIGGVDHAGLIVDLQGSEITKTGDHTSSVVETTGIDSLIVSNINIEADNKAARGWYHYSGRSEFTGFCRFVNCFANNILQVDNSVPAVAWRVAGAMEYAEMIGGGASNVTPGVGVTAKVSRGFQSSSNFAAELVGLRNFPRVTICRGAKFDTITDDTDGDAVAVLHASTAQDWSKSAAIIEDCQIINSKKRAVKTQCAWTEARRNTIQHTVDAGGLAGEEFGIQLGGCVVEDNSVYYDGTPRCVIWLGVSTNPSDFGRQVFQRNKVYLNGGDATSGDYTKTSLVQGAEMLGDAVYHPGLEVSDNEVIGGSYKHLVYLRPKSRSTGIVTVGPVLVSGNLCDLTEGLIAFKRASAVPGDVSAFYSKIELLTITRNTNTLADVPAIDEIDVNVSYTRSGWDENKGLEVPRAATDITTYEFDVPYGLSNVAHTFDVPFTGTDIQSFEVSATCSVAFATTRQSHFLGYLHVASGVITEYAIGRRDDSYSGLWSFSLLSSPDRLRVTKAAGAGGAPIRGHVTVKLKS